MESQTTWIESKHKHLGPFQGGNHCELFSYLTLVFLAVIFSGQLLLSRELTGEFFELKPFNYMLGPSSEIMIKTGARFPPCMRTIDAFPPNEVYEPNLNSTCDLMDICSMTGFHQEQKPDQTFRFLTPLFVHAGIIPLFINNMYLILVGIRVEKAMGSLLYAVLFIGSGFFGQVFGANLASPTKIYLGCNSSILGLIGYLYVDLIYYWKQVIKPVSCLVKLVLLTIVTFCLGFIPWVDHFSNLGGFVSGVVLGMLLIRIQKPITKRKVSIIIQRVFAFLVYLILLGILIYRFINVNIH
ncbi:rhomboid-domain-containing protein [Backusella circina FSU 941]|nr:rhomboid-domain-containing protein [Backusella circina FSU 941]